MWPAAAAAFRPLRLPEGSLGNLNAALRAWSHPSLWLGPPRRAPACPLGVKSGEGLYLAQATRADWTRGQQGPAFLRACQWLHHPSHAARVESVARPTRDLPTGMKMPRN
jgi:hypothetical protein